MLEVVRIDHVPGLSAATCDLLDEAVLRPVVGVYGDLFAALVEDPGELSVELCVVDELVLAPLRRRRRHRSAVELVHSGCRVGTARKAEGEAVTFTPRVRANRQAELSSEPHGEPAGSEHQRLFGPCPGVWHQGMPGLDLAGRTNERLGQSTRIEAPTRRAGVLGLGADERSAERLQPLECAVEPLDDQALQARVAVRALAPKLLQGAIPPDDAAREQHRPAGPVALPPP